MDADQTLTIDGSAVVTGTNSLVIDGSLESDGNLNIIGGAGDDTLTGGAGNDSIDGGGGDDIVDGGLGDDTYIASAGNDTITTGDGNDMLTFGVEDTVYGSRIEDADSDGTADDLVLSYDFFDGTDYIYSTATILNQTVAADALYEMKFDADEDGALDTFRVATTMSAAGQAGRWAMAGTDTGETITGSDQGDVIRGNAGDDTIQGGLGDDFLEGNAGDWVFYDDATGSGVTVDLAAHFEGYASMTFADANPDTITAYVGAFVDSVGNNLQAGTQITISDSQFNNGTYTVASTSADGSVVTLSAGDALTAEGPVDASFTGTSAVASGGGLGNDTLIGIENVEGSSYADTLIGDGGANRLTGLEGGDQIFGAAGDDTIDGGEGNDVITGGQGSDIAVFSGVKTGYGITADGIEITVTDTDTTERDEGTNLLYGIETLRFTDDGTPDNPVSSLGLGMGSTYTGGTGADTYSGGTANNDIYYASGGNDTLTLTGGGNDG
ncbi:MAG: calcium-binding protein [Rhodospirillales bacterium]|nr:calcium-binding protein [Rhodospirillales bacterium]HIJ43902.1 hypothetical protein [Rhodospirillaceae bacterium]HIJ93848.1 hypothetical protein [Rhodospirillaceae bacterium]HJP54946.1 calcium-binding protein [Rhodospirillales bacterium]